jgi:hypothetical protein
MMGANYLTISLPFFTTRAALLAIPYENKLKNKDRDQMLASVVSGATIGASLSYYTRGTYAIIPGLITYGLIASVGQFIYTYFRHQRLNKALHLHNSKLTPSDPITIPPPSPSVREIWQSYKFLSNEDFTVQDRDLDPLKDFFNYSVAKINSWFGDSEDIPDWASPLVNALDIDYRKKLNVRINILNGQVSELEEQKKQLKE